MLELDGCNGLTGEASLGALAPQLWSLSIKFCLQAVPHALGQVSRLTCLRRLELSEMPAVCDGAMQQLGRALPSVALAHLTLGGPCRVKTTQSLHPHATGLSLNECCLTFFCALERNAESREPIRHACYAC